MGNFRLGHGLLRFLEEWGGALSDVIFPRVCQVCGCALVKGEEVLCLDCLLAMPRTNFHKTLR